MRALRILLATSLLAAAAYLGLGWLIYQKLSSVRPGAYAESTPAAFHFSGSDSVFDTRPYRMPRYRTVRLPSRTPGLRLAGWWVPGDTLAPAVVVAHGLGDSKGDPGALLAAGMLHRAGFGVLLFDFRNHGASDLDDGRTSAGNKEYLDVLGAWDWVVREQHLPPSRVGVYGMSLGAGAALIALAREPRVPAVFLDSPYADLRVKIGEELTRARYPAWLAEGGILMARLAGGVDLLQYDPEDAIAPGGRRPIYSVHGLADRRTLVHHTDDLARLARARGARFECWEPPGVGHVGAALKFPGEYERRLVAFFRAAL